MAEVILDKAGKTYPGGVRAVEGFDLETFRPVPHVLGELRVD